MLPHNDVEDEVKRVRIWTAEGIQEQDQWMEQIQKHAGEHHLKFRGKEVTFKREKGYIM